MGVLETCLTLGVLGPRSFFRDCGCRFDFTVMLATVVSISYGLVHIAQGEITQADVPLLCLRFVLQPARMMAVCMGACRAREMQDNVNDLPVDFGVLESQSNVSLQPHINTC